uniref:CSON003003 protein n=1 Tax=Culicoides sonorensis TaxID=179676 RepID=A0A336LX74_CULSO
MNLSLVDMQQLYMKFPDLKKTDIDHIREWMKKQPHLPEISDQEIAIHLHAKYFSIEAAKFQIDTDLTLRTHAKDLFSMRDVLGDDMQMVKDVIASFPLPNLTPEGDVVLLWKLINPDVTKFSFKSVLKMGLMTYETDILEKGPPDGCILAIDMEGMTLKHLLNFNIMLGNQAVTFMQDAYRMRLKALCYFNLFPYFDKFLNIFKPMLNKDVANQLKLYDSYEGLKELFPLDILPCDYKGGKADSIANLWKNYMEYLEGRRQYFLEEERTRRVTENLRPDKSPLDSGLFGMEGSFKKLSFD